VLGYGRTTSSTATAWHHCNDGCAKARTKRKARNREHLRAFSFYFCTSKHCNLTPPFAYYKRGGRDPRPKGRNNTMKWQCTKHTLKHSNTHTHTQRPESYPSLDQLVSPYYKHFSAKQHEQQRALEVGTFSPSQYTSCVCLAHHRRLRRVASFTCAFSRHPPF
jgi:protein-tyrosine phosphatase